MSDLSSIMIYYFRYTNLLRFKFTYSLVKSKIFSLSWFLSFFSSKCVFFVFVPKVMICTVRGILDAGKLSVCLHETNFTYSQLKVKI
jgi:integral membrane sensor domain MASE1